MLIEPSDCNLHDSRTAYCSSRPSSVLENVVPFLGDVVIYEFLIKQSRCRADTNSPLRPVTIGRGSSVKVMWAVDKRSLTDKVLRPRMENRCRWMTIFRVPSHHSSGRGGTSAVTACPRMDTQSTYCYLISINSTKKCRVAFGGITPPAPCSP